MVLVFICPSIPHKGEFWPGNYAKKEWVAVLSRRPISILLRRLSLLFERRVVSRHDPERDAEPYPEEQSNGGLLFEMLTPIANGAFILEDLLALFAIDTAQ